MFCTISTIYRPETGLKSLFYKFHALSSDIVKLAHETKTSIHYQVTCKFLSSYMQLMYESFASEVSFVWPVK